MKIILERNLDFNQFKTLFIVNFMSIAFLFIAIKLGAAILLVLILVSFIMFLTSLLIIKKGLTRDHNKLFLGYFLFGLLIRKKEIDNTGMNIITQLIYRKSTNYNYSTKWEPGFRYKEISFELYFVNENHTVKKKIIELTREDNSKKAIDFLLLNIKATFQKFSPSI